MPHPHLFSHSSFNMASKRTPINISIAQLNRLLKDIVPDWLVLGIQLRVPLPQLRIIESHVGSKSIDDKFSMMIDQWYKVSTDPSWSEIITALEAIGNKRLANIIESKYGKGKVTVDKPTLQGILKECLPNWSHFGLMLGIAKSELDIIDDRDPYSRYLSDTLQYWMSNSEDVTWDCLVEALKNIGNQRLAAQIADKYIG